MQVMAYLMLVGWLVGWLDIAERSGCQIHPRSGPIGTCLLAKRNCGMTHLLHSMNHQS
jgi:hypothetical protein